VGVFLKFCITDISNDGSIHCTFRIERNNYTSDLDCFSVSGSIRLRGDKSTMSHAIDLRDTQFHNGSHFGKKIVLPLTNLYDICSQVDRSTTVGIEAELKFAIPQEERKLFVEYIESKPR
jgi:hypothetical protein